MTVYLDKARGKWRWHFVLAGERHSGYCKDEETGDLATNRTQAKAMERQARARIEAARKAPAIEAAPDSYTWGRTLAALALRKKGQKSWTNTQTYIRELLSWFGAETPAAAITEQRVWEYIDWARQQRLRVYMGGGRKVAAAGRSHKPESMWKDGDKTRSDATINRYLNVIREALAIAATARDADGRPMLPHPPKIPSLDEGTHIPRPIPDSILDAVIAQGPPHLADAALLVRHMGFRKREVFSLTPAQVDSDLRGVWLNASQTKGKRAEFISANATAWAKLAELKAAAIADGRDFLIGYRHRGAGPLQPVKNPRKAWNTLMAGLGVSYRWHDTKASFVSAVGAVASGPTTQELARHRNFSTTQRYLAVSDPVRRAALAAIDKAAPATPADAAPALATAGTTQIQTHTLMTKSEYGRRHGVTIDAVTHWIKRGWVPAEALRGAGRQIRIVAELADAGLQRNRWIGKRQPTGARANPCADPCADPGHFTAISAPIRLVTFK